MLFLSLLLLVCLASAQTMNACQTALTNLGGLFEMLPDASEAYPSVFRTLCLQYELETAGTGISFPNWIDGYKSHMALNAFLGSVQMGFQTLFTAQIVRPTVTLLGLVNSMCTPEERMQGAKDYSSLVQTFAEELLEEQEAFAQRFPFYVNTTFAGDAFVTSNQLLAYGQNVTAEISA